MHPKEGKQPLCKHGRIRRPGALAATCAVVYGSAWCRTGHSTGFVAPPSVRRAPGDLHPHLSEACLSSARRTARPIGSPCRSCSRVQARAGILPALQNFWRTMTIPRALGIFTLLGIISLYLGRPKSDMTDGDAMQARWSMYARSPMRRQVSLTAGMLRAGFQVLRAKLARGKKKSKLQSQAGNAIVQELLKLGPTYVKLGQIASCRSDLLSTEYIDQLKKLQDAVPAFGPERARRRLEEELGKKIEDVFESFDAKALAAASLGQVHRAKLLDGTEVAIKIQRGDLREMYDLDLAQFEKVIKVLDKFKIGVSGASQNWLEIFEEAKVLLYREIDYRAEAQNSEAVRKNFVKEGDKFKWLKIPKVFTELTTEQILTMEYVPGTKITDNAALAKLQGVDRVKLGERVGEAYLVMLCKHGFFNTDPHPGNLAVDTAVPGGRIIMYDFGQACALTDSQCDGILQCIQSIVDLDAEACVKSFDKLGVLKPDADRKAVLAKVKNNFDTGKIRSKASKGPEADASIKADKEASGAEKYFQFPSQLGFVFRALTQLQGVGTCLDPEWEFIESVAPKVPEVQMARGAGLDYLAGEFLKQLRGRTTPKSKKKA